MGSKGEFCMQARILETILPVFLSLFIGIVIRKTKMIDRRGMDAIRKLALNITLPAVVFSAFSAADYSPKTIGIPIMFYLIGGVGLALGYIANRTLKMGARAPFMMSCFEIGMMGYGLYALLYKGQSNSMIALVDLGAAAFVFTIYKGMATGKGDLKSSLLSTFKTPNIWAIFAGAVIGATGLYTHPATSGAFKVLTGAADFLGAPTGALILLGIGYDLELKNVRWSNVLRIVITRAVIVAITFVIAYFANAYLLGGILPIGTLGLVFILPPPYIAPVFADTDTERADLSSALSILTIICLAGFTVLSFIV